MKRSVFCVLVMLLITSAAHAKKIFDFNPVCQQAYNEIVKLRIEPGKALIAKARQQNPDNLIPELLEGYIDFFVLFFNEDPQEYAARKDNFGRRIAAFEQGPQNSPFSRYCRAVTYLQRASVKIKFGERYGAGFDFKKANSFIKDNQAKYPNFQPNNMIAGPIQVAIGTVPQGYKWITSLLGLKGSISTGMQVMRNFLNSNDAYAKLFANEAIFYYSYLTFYIQNKPDEVFKLIQTKKLDLVNNHLFTYLASNLAINSKQSKAAESIILNRNKSAEYMATPVWDFEIGYAKIHHLELDEAITYFNRFTTDFKGNFYLKDALQKMSWAYYLKGDTANAEKYRQLTLRRGNTDSDADKKAYKDAKAKLWSPPILLKARLLNDGGFNREALEMLAQKSVKDFPKPEEALDFSYRLARINDDLGRDDEAINFYQTTINLGKARQEYYAARAALQLGIIYEQRGQKAQAIKYFQQCIDMEDHEYKDSLDQRAKSGIARCKGE
ncbi:MAG: hypothetical protein JWQ96_82 [Segetibacter sp.]|nr:hypothetical protein [Segetibacter sp.]